MKHELHAARLVEEALQHHALGRRDRPERALALVEEIRELRGRRPREPQLAHRPLRVAALGAHPRQRRRQLARAGRGLAEPERQARRCSARIRHTHRAGLHLEDPPRCVAELEDVADARLDREILVERSNHRFLGLEHDAVLAGVRDRAARCERRDPRAARGAQPAVHAVPVEQGGATFGVESHSSIEVVAREIAIGPGAAERVVEPPLVPGLGDAGGDDLLREDVERARGLRRAVQLAALDSVHQRNGSHQILLREREDAPFRRAAEPVAAAAHALEQGRDRGRDPHLNHQVHIAHVDPQLQRRCRDQRPQLPLLQPLLGVQPLLARQAPVMARYKPLPERGREPGGDALGKLARVHEHQRGAVRVDQLRHAPHDLVPGLVRAGGGERRLRNLDPEVEVAAVPDVHALALALDAGEQPRDVLDRLLRGGEPDALERPLDQRLEPLHRERQVGAALVACYRVDLVQDQCAHRAQHRAAGIARA